MLTPSSKVVLSHCFRIVPVCNWGWLYVYNVKIPRLFEIHNICTIIDVNTSPDEYNYSAGSRAAQNSQLAGLEIPPDYCTSRCQRSHISVAFPFISSICSAFSSPSHFAMCDIWSCLSASIPVVLWDSNNNSETKPFHLPRLAALCILKWNKLLL